MQTAAPGRDELRRLAELRLERPLVLSLYLDLDPAEFATPPARATAIRSLLDQAERQVKEAEGLSHDERSELEGTLERAQAFLEHDLPTDGAHGVVLFAAGSADLFEALSLPRSLPSRAALGHSPLVGPLARLERRERWCVTLVSRRAARVFFGSADGLREVEQIVDDVSGQHKDGGWAQGRYSRGVEKEKDDHLRNTGDALMRRFKRRPFERLIVGGPREVVSDFESALHGYLQERLAGRIEVDVDSSSAEEVLEAAMPRFEELDAEREREALERVGEGSRSAGGLEDVLRALNERRVEVLMLDEQFSAQGAVCPSCGLLAASAEGECPLDGSALELVEEITDPAIELAVQQAAEVLFVQHERERLEGLGGIAVLLRF
ncbi:MAG TPA: Vms1/Ankzf1 family peptidyl-tRNA hydrolase [Thermoleophilaceae bacterium]|nr:Vms1/Ankzf1 family peptidyl-tRNA hydrolase [Thermoleophilaceae bacterium]